MRKPKPDAGGSSATFWAMMTWNGLTGLKLSYE
jgi:hypothetical protein